ncbi:MAG: DUF1850 domain-containing protein [Rhizobacter sp.]|nr:DUF1850 domain-containing protein [Rhizobacter sp.]
MGPTLLCLAAAVGGPAVTVPLPEGRFTLAWTHSIEKIEWREDYLAAGGWLLLEQATIHGNGAGMDVPDDAQHIPGGWRYRPALRWHHTLRLTRSPYTADYRLCFGGHCSPLTRWLPIDSGLTLVTDCTREPPP